MTKASKQVKRGILAKQFSEARKAGKKGSVHTKANTEGNHWWQKFSTYGESLRSNKGKPQV